MLDDFLSLLFPNPCIACDDALMRGEVILCTSCNYHLPRTNYHFDHDNEIKKRFAGKIPLSFAFCYLKFIKGGSVQKIIYNIKYGGNKEAAIQFGMWYGQDLKNSNLNDVADIITAVPLHKNKLKRRGFNQSDCFAEGLSGTLNIPLVRDIMIRQEEKISQTNMNRLERWDNVKDIYKVKEKSLVANKRVLLVDDVITTGATLEACALSLLEYGASEVSIAAMAAAQ